jgi:hypothetical protein
VTEDAEQLVSYRLDRNQVEEVLAHAAAFLSEAEQTWERMRRTDQ